MGGRAHVCPGGGGMGGGQGHILNGCAGMGVAMGACVGAEHGSVYVCVSRCGCIIPMRSPVSHTSLALSHMSMEV